MKNTVKSISDLLMPNQRELQTILSKVKAIKSLNQIIIPMLPANLQKYCQIANLSQGVLTILTSNGSAAAELRYHLGDLLKMVRTVPTLKHIREIQSKVSPSSQPVGVERGKTTKRPYKPSPLSQATADIMQAMAETIEDPKLRDIMLNIAQHGNKKID